MSFLNENMKNLITSFFFTIIFFSILSAKSPEKSIKEPIQNYKGKCPCPYSIISNGRYCEKKSAYLKEGSLKPLCYISDIKNNGEIFKINSLKIVDGDTIHIGKIKYRLYGIDAPEIQQKCKRGNKTYLCGVEATKFLKSLIEDESKIRCKKKDIDRYKRIVAICYYYNQDLNKLMVKNGWAIAYRKYSKDYIDDENFAKENKLGIWEGNFLNPEQWRRRKR